ncbi:MAG: hypothetical protein P1U53_00540 [Sulfitobacter sp.]|nr:hypothetical protein [Sulfitobacter sp.]
MSLDTLPDLRCLLLWDGALYGNLDSARDLHPLELRTGAARAPFEPCLAPPPGLFHPPQIHPFDTSHIVKSSTSNPVEANPGEVYALWVNHLPDWTLQGAETIQLMINQYERPCDVALNSPLHVPHVVPGMRFEAKLGAHRARARLKLRFSDPTTGQEELRHLTFDSACPGGTQPGGFAPLNQPLPDGFSACRIDLVIEYLGHLADGKGTEPFLFLADLRVISPTAAKAASGVTTPAWLLGAEELATGDWIRAPLPESLIPGQGLSVRMGRQDYPFTPMPKPVFEVRENYGHTLVCSAAEEMKLVLYIDHQPVSPVRINRNDTVLRLPNRYLNGHVRHLALKDRSGSVTLFARQQLMPAIVTPAEVMQRESVAPFPDALFAQTPSRHARRRRQR